MVATSGQVFVVTSSRVVQQPFPQHHLPRSVKGRVEAACPMAAPVRGMEATAANRTSATNIQQGNRCLPTIQSVSQACTPCGAKQRFGSLLTFPQLIVWTCFLPMNQCPITAMHLQFPGPTPRLLQNSFSPVINEVFANVGRTTANSGPTLNLRGANKMCNCVDPGGEDFMPLECPAHVRRRVPNGSAEFSKMHVQGLWAFVVHGTTSTCKAHKG